MVEYRFELEFVYNQPLAKQPINNYNGKIQMSLSEPIFTAYFLQIQIGNQSNKETVK